VLCVVWDTALPRLHRSCHIPSNHTHPFQVGGVEDKDVDLTGPAAMVSAVAEAVSDAIEAVTDQLAPTDATVPVGDDEDGGPVVGLGACGSPIGASAEDKPAGAATVAVEGAAATGNNVPVVGEVEAVVPAEEGAADPAVGMEERPVSTPASVGGSAAAVVASSVSLEGEVRVVLQWHVDARCQLSGVHRLSGRWWSVSTRRVVVAEDEP